MTFAPASLTADRQYLLDTFDMHPGTVPSDLDPAEVGIVGDAAHRGGYHCGSDRLAANDYSNQTKRDRAGLTEAASALDIGRFWVEGADGKTHSDRALAIWVVAECRKGAPDTKDIREVIYSPDGLTVYRWDRENGQNSKPVAGGGDNSHLTHSHYSRYRDAQNRRLTPLFQRWHEEIAMPTPEEYAKAVWDADYIPAPRPPVNDDDFDTNPTWRGKNTLRVLVEEGRNRDAAIEALTAKVDQVLAALAGGTPLPPAASNVSVTGILKLEPAPQE